ncbi:MAG: MSCRAMM family protein, partial [Terriglobia bacterium]
DLRVRVWQGSLGSNRLPIQLRPAPAANVASVGGAVLSREMQPDWGILVSLSDWNERLIAQSVTGNDGGFSFSRLPYGRYWVTVRQPGADYETGFFEHADLSASHPDARLKLIMLNQEEYEANQMLHKPVLFRIVDGAGNPVNGAMLHILWSNGTVMETVRAVTGQDGLAETNLLPGSNYVTIEKRHCRKEDRMANAAAGIGIEGFSITYDCGK